MTDKYCVPNGTPSVVWRQPFFYPHQIPNGITTRCLTAILIICGILFFGMAKAQSITETRQIKTTALQVYETYKVVMAGLYSNSAYTEDNFMALFEKESLIYNDILPDNQPQYLSPANYFKKFKTSIRRIYPAFSDFKMGEPTAVGNRWQIKCHFTRGTRFSTQKDMKYPEWSFNYVITVEMDKRYDTVKKVYENAKIVNVDVENPLKGFFVIENKENIPLATKSGEMLKEWDEEYQSRIFPEDKWKIEDIVVPSIIYNGNVFVNTKYKISQSKTDVHFYHPDGENVKKNFVGLGVNYSPLFFGKNMSEADNMNALTLSLFVGEQIAHKGNRSWFFNIAMDLNCYQNDVISISNPWSIQYLHQITHKAKKPVFLSLELGAFLEIPLKNEQIYHGGIIGGIGLWRALNENNLLKLNLLYKENYLVSKDIRNFGIGISWVKTIGE